MDNRNRFNLSNSDVDYIARNIVMVEREAQEYRDIFGITTSSTTKTSSNTYSANPVKSFFMVLVYLVYRLALIGLFVLILLYGYRFFASIFLKWGRTIF